MREVKFRGKALNSGQWVHGSLITASGRYWIKDESNTYINPRQINGENKTADFRCIEVIPESVSQFTGLHDKNGKEIYEGDILLENNAGDLWTWIVKWDEDGYYFILHEPSGEKIVMDDMLEVVRNSRAIGNTYENPIRMAGDNP